MPRSWRIASPSGSVGPLAPSATNLSLIWAPFRRVSGSPCCRINISALAERNASWSMVCLYRNPSLRHFEKNIILQGHSDRNLSIIDCPLTSSIQSVLFRGWFRISPPGTDIAKTLTVYVASLRSNFLSLAHNSILKTTPWPVACVLPDFRPILRVFR